MYEVANETAEAKAYLTNLHALKRIASPDELAQWFLNVRLSGASGGRRA
jgi:hypothetical protein